MTTSLVVTQFTTDTGHWPCFFFFNDTATTEIYTLSLHDALPIFFDEWVRGAGIPHYRVEFTAHRDDTGYSVRGKLFQTGVPRSFLASVPLYATGSSGGRSFLGNVLAAGPETAFRFHTSSPPHKILIDARMTLLCTTD